MNNFIQRTDYLLILSDGNQGELFEGNKLAIKNGIFENNENRTITMVNMMERGVLIGRFDFIIEDAK